MRCCCSRNWVSRPIEPRFRSSGPTSRSAPWSSARAGIYTEAAVAGVSPARLKRFFVKADHGYQIQKFVRELCVFARHDLAKDPPFSKLDLISCRNVLIYMGPALQKRILSMFQYALKPGGFLFLGNSESISDYSDVFTAEDRKHRIFLRKPAAAAFREFNSTPDRFREPDSAAPKATAASVAVDFRKEAEGDSAGALRAARPDRRSGSPYRAFSGRHQPLSGAGHGAAQFSLAENGASRVGGGSAHGHLQSQARRCRRPRKTLCSSSIRASPPRYGWKCGRSRSATARNRISW